MGPAVVRAICDLTSGVFEHLEIPSAMDLDKKVNYTQRLIRGPMIKKYKTFLAECNE